MKTEHTEADWGQLARCTGFAQTPRILNVLAFIPVVGGLIRPGGINLEFSGNGGWSTAGFGLYVDLSGVLIVILLALPFL